MNSHLENDIIENFVTYYTPFDKIVNTLQSSCFIVSIIIAFLIGYMLFYYKPTSKVLLHTKINNIFLTSGCFYTLMAIVFSVFSFGIYIMTQQNSHIYFAKQFNWQSYMLFLIYFICLIIIVCFLLKFSKVFTTFCLFLVKWLIVNASLLVFYYHSTLYTALVLILSIIITWVLCRKNTKAHLDVVKTNLAFVGQFVYSKFRVFLFFYGITAAIQSFFILVVITYVTKGTKRTTLLPLHAVFAIMWVHCYIDLINKQVTAFYCHNLNNSTQRSFLKAIKAVKNTWKKDAAISIMFAGLNLLIWKVAAFIYNIAKVTPLLINYNVLIVIASVIVLYTLEAFLISKYAINDLDIARNINSLEQINENVDESYIESKLPLYKQRITVSLILRGVLLAIYLFTKYNNLSIVSFELNYSCILFGLLHSIQANVKIISFSFIFFCSILNAFISSYEIIYLVSYLTDSFEKTALFLLNYNARPVLFTKGTHLLLQTEI